MGAITHAELVKKAAQWLRAQRCAVVMTELVTVGEIPDAIGWSGTCSTLIECKASRADFLSDGKKYFRRYPEIGAGLRRYYMAPVGLIGVEEVPPKWGLLEVMDMGIVRKSKEVEVLESTRVQEIQLLLSALRRIGHTAPQGVSIKCYTIDSKNTATLGIVEEEASVPRGTVDNEKQKE